MSILRNRLLFSSSEDSDSDDDMPVKKMKVRPRINFGGFGDFEFKERFRMRQSEVEMVLQYIGPKLQYKTSKNQALSPKQQLLVFLHWLGTGCQYHGVGDMHGIGKGSVCKIVKRVSNAVLTEMFHQFVRWPENTGEVALEFLRKGGFPHVIGCIDGSLINIDSPRTNEAAYVDRYGDHSINIMTVCGPDRRFYYVSARWPGSVHDSRVLRNSRLCHDFEAGIRPFPGALILGDSGYGLKDWLITPICRNAEDPAELAFNRAHKSTRSLVECAYGVVKERFPCLNYLRLEPLKACKIITVCATLHNIASQDDFPFTPNPTTNNPQQNWNVEPTEAGRARVQELLGYFA